MSAINNDSGMDVMQKYNAMMSDQQYQNILGAKAGSSKTGFIIYL